MGMPTAQDDMTELYYHMSKAGRLRRAHPVRMLLFLATCLAVPLTLFSVSTFGTLVTAVPVALFAAVVAIAALGMSRHFPFPVIGLCNAITLGRAGMVCYLVGFAILPAAFVSHGWTVFWVASIALLLDGVDGWLARREGLQSTFGARFDMEIDALLGLILSVILLTATSVGPWILLLGGLRYFFLVASIVLVWLQAPLPHSFRRKLVCVVQIGTLVLLTLPLLPAGLTMPLTAIAVVALIYSFTVDVCWLARQRG